MTIRTTLICALSLALSPAVHALNFCNGSGSTESCQPDPPAADSQLKCPGESGLMVIQSTESAPLCVLEVNAPVALLHECVPAPGGMVCEGWAQEVSVPKRYLSYSWSVRVGWVTTQYDTGHEAYVDFGCNNGQSVRVTMTVTNGTYSASTQQSYTCGDDIQ